jgi:hypothetical protein
MLFLVTRFAHGPPSPRRGQIGDRDHVYTEGGAGLGKEHGPELPGPDDTDPDRFPVGRSVAQQGVHVHGLLRSRDVLSHLRNRDVNMCPHLLPATFSPGLAHWRFGGISLPPTSPEPSGPSRRDLAR